MEDDKQATALVERPPVTRLRRDGRLVSRELLRVAQAWALVVDPWEERTNGPLAERRYELLQREPSHDIWLIHWPTSRGLELHDHGGSNGAFYVVTGALVESSVAPPGLRLRTRRRRSGDGACFGPSYVHSVINEDQPPATSVHVYSPPITSMNFFEQTAGGIVVTRTEREWVGAP